MRLMARLAAGESFTATLAGARVESDGARAHLMRDASDGRRKAMGDLVLPHGEAVVWDGRFEITAWSIGSRMGPLAGRAGRLPPALREALAALSPSARRAVPVVTYPEGALTLPTLRPDPAMEVYPLGLARLAGACGAIIDEAALWRMAKSLRHT